jgi:hypothetical protein
MHPVVFPFAQRATPDAFGIGAGRQVGQVRDSAASTVTSVKALVPRRNSLNLLIFTLRAGRARSYPSTPCSGTITPDIR